MTGSEILQYNIKQKKQKNINERKETKLNKYKIK